MPLRLYVSITIAMGNTFVQTFTIVSLGMDVTHPMIVANAVPMSIMKVISVRLRIRRKQQDNNGMVNIVAITVGLLAVLLLWRNERTARRSTGYAGGFVEMFNMVIIIALEALFFAIWGGIFWW